MRSIFALAILALVVTTQAQWHSCPVGICARSTCESMSEQTCLSRGAAGKFVYNPHGGFCGCCASCTKILDEGEDCHQMMIMDKPASEICRDGLKCDLSSTRCVKKTVEDGH